MYSLNDLSPQEINLLHNALQELPMKMVEPLVAKVRAQIVTQDQARAAKAAAAVDKEQPPTTAGAEPQ